jgi:sortase A
VYVDAMLSGDAQPAGDVGQQDPGGALMSRDHSVATMAFLALALELLILTLVAIVWARHKWSSIAAWVTGAPMVLAALWITSLIASRLLPNLV